VNLGIPAQDVIFWSLSLISLAGAATVVLTRDVMRLTLGLGVFFLSVAGWYLYFGHGFLAAAQVFLYAGGVLVLVLFAIMFLRRSDDDGKPVLESRHSLDSLVMAAGVGLLVAMSLRGHTEERSVTPMQPPDVHVSEILLGQYLPQLMAVGLLLLVAVVTALVALGGDRE